MTTQVQNLVKTKRIIHAQIIICSGCCCGHTEKDKPHIPIDWLKSTWKEHKLIKHVQLTISGCLGPCDIANVVHVITARKQFRLGQVTEEWQYTSLFDWLKDCAKEGKLMPFPSWFYKYHFENFHQINGYQQTQ